MSRRSSFDNKFWMSTSEGWMKNNFWIESTIKVILVSQNSVFIHNLECIKLWHVRLASNIDFLNELPKVHIVGELLKIFHCITQSSDLFFCSLN